MAICRLSEKIQAAYLSNTRRGLDFFVSLHLTIFERPSGLELFSNRLNRNSPRGGTGLMPVPPLAPCQVLCYTANAADAQEKRP